MKGGFRELFIIRNNVTHSIRRIVKLIPRTLPVSFIIGRCKANRIAAQLRNSRLYSITIAANFLIYHH